MEVGVANAYHIHARSLVHVEQEHCRLVVFQTHEPVKGLALFLPRREVEHLDSWHFLKAALHVADAFRRAGEEHAFVWKVKMYISNSFL